MDTLTEKRNLKEELHAAFVQRGLGTDPSRQQAMDLFLTKGFPGSKAEEYKFTPVTRLLEKVLDASVETTSLPVSAPAFLPTIKNLKCNVVAFVNGHFSRELSVILDPDLQLQVKEPEASIFESDPFSLLNQAFNSQYIEINVGAKKTIQHPVAVVYYFSSSHFVFANPRWRCKIGANSSLSLAEFTQVQDDTPYFNNKLSTVEVGENAEIEYTILQHSPKDIQVQNSFVHLSASARAACFTFTFDGQLVRNNLTLTIDGPGADARLHGLYLLSKNTHADNHTVVDHRKPNSFSNELYKGVMDGNSKGVFNGKIYVRPDAQKTNAFQSNRNILLSETATVNTKPQLEIWADDVKCSHGCTTGQLDEEALFYLRSRGISKEMAKGMILYAFATETFASMKNEALKSFVDSLVAEKLNKSF